MKTDETTADIVKRVIRESLQLAPEDAILDDMQLSGGEYEADSVDMLLIVTSLEKEFGMTIPNDQIGPETFSTVRKIVGIIEQGR